MRRSRGLDFGDGGEVRGEGVAVVAVDEGSCVWLASCLGIVGRMAYVEGTHDGGVRVNTRQQGAMRLSQRMN